MFNALVSTTYNQHYHSYPSSDVVTAEANNVVELHVAVRHIWQGEQSGGESIPAPAGSLKITVDAAAPGPTFDRMWLTMYVAPLDSQGPILAAATKTLVNVELVNLVSFGPDIYAKIGTTTIFTPNGPGSAGTNFVTIRDTDYAGLTEIKIVYSGLQMSGFHHESYFSSISTDGIAASASTPNFYTSEPVPTARHHPTNSSCCRAVILDCVWTRHAERSGNHWSKRARAT